MVRNYERKTTRGSYPQEKMDEAINAVKSGKLSSTKASEIYNIPRSSIMHRIYKKNSKVYSLGRNPVVPSIVEENLVACLRIFENSGFELTQGDLVNIVARYVKRNNIRNPFKDGKPGVDWMSSFRKRHNFCVKNGILTSIDPLIVCVKTECEYTEEESPQGEALTVKESEV